MAEEKTSLLDDLKKLEATKKKQVLAAVLNKIKDDALEVVKLKERYKIFMEQLGVSEKEAKQIIDWINSLVELTNDDREQLKKDVARDLESKRKSVEKKIEEAPMWNGTPFNTSYLSAGNLTSFNNATYGSTNLGTTAYTSLNGNAIVVN